MTWPDNYIRAAMAGAAWVPWPVMSVPAKEEPVTECALTEILIGALKGAAKQVDMLRTEQAKLEETLRRNVDVMRDRVGLECKLAEAEDKLTAALQFSEGQTRELEEKRKESARLHRELGDSRIKIEEQESELEVRREESARLHTALAAAQAELAGMRAQRSRT
jgi:DNA repair exonuclease SbcCD ATPase subunit